MTIEWTETGDALVECTACGGDGYCYDRATGTEPCRACAETGLVALGCPFDRLGCSGEYTAADAIAAAACLVGAAELAVTAANMTHAFSARELADMLREHPAFVGFRTRSGGIDEERYAVLRAFAQRWVRAFSDADRGAA